MGLTVAITRVACETDAAPNTQDITTADLGGLTPKAAILIASYATSDGAAAADHVLSVGFTDGTNETVSADTDEDGQATTDTDSTFSSSLCVMIRVPGDQSNNGTAEFSSWIANGIRINWTDEPSAAYLLTVILFAGTDLSAAAGDLYLGNTEDQVNNITAPGFTPDVVFTAAGWNSAHERTGLGAVHFDGASTIVQRSLAFASASNQGTSTVGLQLRNDSGIFACDANGALNWYGVFSDFDADGFSVTIRNDGGDNQKLHYLALNFNSAVDAWVGTHTTPTSTGNDSETGPGFTPQFVYVIPSLGEAIDTAYGDNRAGTFGVSAFDADDEYTTVVSSEDGAGTSNTQSLSDDRAIVVPDDDGTLDIEATFVSFDANGWTVNYSNAPGTAKLFPALAIEAEGGAPSLSIPVAMHHYMHKVFG